MSADANNYNLQNVECHCEISSRQGCNQLFISEGGDFHEISFDDVIVLIEPWCANRQR